MPDRVGLGESAAGDDETTYRRIPELLGDEGEHIVVLLDHNGRIEWINPKGREVFEEAGVCQSAGGEWAGLWPPALRSQAADAIGIARDGQTHRFAARLPTAKAADRFWDVAVSAVSPGSADTRLVALARDVTAYHGLITDELCHAAAHDALTGLAYRKLLHSHVDAAIGRRAGFSICVIDFDHFKQVNDSFGHGAGDVLLRCGAARLRAMLRPGDCAARLGGDEFAVMILDATGNRSMDWTARLLDVLNQPIVYGDRSIQVSASIGSASFPADADSFDELLRHADAALYAAKAAGRACVRRFDGELRQDIQRNMAMLRLADAALRDDRIVPYYQPKVDLRDGRLVGLEALLRWHGHDGGIHLPEEIGRAFGGPALGPRLSERMLNRIIADVGRWRSAGLPSSVAINCASVDVLDEAFADRLLRRLWQAGLPPSSIELEITEDVLLTACPARVEGNLQRLSAAGARIALDDFGTGFASLTHLKRFPVDTIKIDRSFVCNMLHDRGDRAIIAALANLAASLDIEVVAEGVEQPAQAEMLRAMGCGVGQGFLYGKAEPASAAQARLAQQSGRCQTPGRVAA